MISRKTLEKEYPNYQGYIRDAFELGQSHIFTWWHEITPAEQRQLLEQIATIDFRFVQKLFSDNLHKAKNTLQGSLLPPKIITVPKSASR